MAAPAGRTSSFRLGVFIITCELRGAILHAECLLNKGLKNSYMNLDEEGLGVGLSLEKSLLHKHEYLSSDPQPVH